MHGNRADDGKLVRFLFSAPVTFAEGAAAFFKPNSELATVQISYFPTSFEQATDAQEIDGFRLDPFHRFSPELIHAAMAGNAQQALNLGYLLSFAVRDEEASKPRSEEFPARFPGKIKWPLVKWLFETALAGGEYIASHNLAYMFFFGLGLNLDYDEAFRLLELAEHLEIKRTFELLAACHAGGLGTPVNMDRATEYRTKSKNTAK